jgi:hypothetical protein
VRGYNTHAVGGVVVHATPWAESALEPAVIEACAVLLRRHGLSVVTFSADRPRGPYLATVGVDRKGWGATPLDALRTAIATTPEWLERDLAASLEEAGT